VLASLKMRLAFARRSHCPPPTNQQYQFLTHTLAKGRNSRGALAVLNQMERRDKIIPSEINIVNAIRSCVESGRFDEAVFMLNEVEVSERSESILAMNQIPRNGYRHMATSTTKLTHSIYFAPSSLGEEEIWEVS